MNRPTTHILLSLVLTFLVSGCVTWQKPGGTPEEFQATKAACTSRAYARFPPMNRQVQISSGYVTPAFTNCTGFGYSANCITTGGQVVAPQTMTVDDNTVPRSQDVTSCLYQHGWRPVQQ
jgi:hypothetical protein